MSIQASLAEKAAALKGKQPAKRKSTWNRPTRDDVAQGQVLAFDQTFSKTGWVLFSNTEHGFDVVAKGYIQEPPIPDEPQKFRDILQRTEWMGERIHRTLVDCLHTLPGLHVVHEAPVLHANRVESSLLGAVKVWEACKKEEVAQPSIVENRRMLNVLVPPGERINQTGKGHIRRALHHFYDVSTGWNEHNRDALALALTYLIDKKRAAT